MGEQDAWETLVREHQEPVFRLAFLILGDAHAAEDVAQEAFMRAFRALDRFDIQRPLRPWLLRIAGNLAKNWRRSLGRYWSALARYWQEEPLNPFSTSDVETAQYKRERSELTLQAVKQLSERDQHIIYLRYFLELSVDETAATLGVAPGTVKSRLHRALDRLRGVVTTTYPELMEGEEA